MNALKIPELKNFAVIPFNWGARFEFEFPSKDFQVIAKQVISAFQNNWTLDFFDSRYPQISDPGAYISFIRTEGKIWAKSANHGWSSGWVRLSDEAAAAYLSSCMQLNSQSKESTKIVEETRIQGSWPGDGRNGVALREYLESRLTG